MEKINLKVNGMHCASCEMLVTDSLRDSDGVENAKANHINGQISIEYNKNMIDLDTISSIIKEEGFEVEKQ